MAEETEKKLTSRKFIVWLLWSLLSVAVVVMGFIRDSETLIIKVFEYYFFVSALYIGGNVATKGIYTYKDVKGGNE